MLKLGTETGSLINHVLSVNNGETPVVGMGVTVLCWSDRYPGTVIEVKTPKLIVVQMDKAERTDENGQSETQTWDIQRDENGETVMFKKLKKGWKGVKSGYGLSLGVRERYYDFSF